MPDLKVNCQLPNFNANLPRKCQLNANLPTANFHCQPPLKNAKFEKVGSHKCQLATLEWRCI